MRNADLEREILAANHDPAAYLVYADWLQTQGDPRGELIIHQLRDRDVKHDAEREHVNVVVDRLTQDLLGRQMQTYLDEHRAEFLGRFATTKPDAFELEWRGGFIKKAVIGWEMFGGESEDDPSSAQLQQFLELESAALIEELLLGPTAHEEELRLDELAGAIEATKPIALRTLLLGDTGDWDISSTHSRMPNSDSIRGIHNLTLRGGSIELGAIDLPELRNFTIESGGLSVDCLKHLANAKWPKLERLEIWFGDPNYGASGGAADIAPLFTHDVPNLRALGLRNCPFADELVARLLGTPLLAQLTSLDLSMGNLSDRGLDALIAARSQLRHLTSIVLDDNALSPKAMTRVGELPNANFGVEQNPERAVPRDEDSYHRYVTVGE
jgi:uncharacterized protein (TIGR02996 family)